MVPSIAKAGHSFKGAFAYYLHDKRQEGEATAPTTSERVAWAETRNLATQNPEAAKRVMVATAKQADALKAAAGIKATGRKSNAHVYAYSLAWHPDEAAKLDRAEMIRAADQSLKALGAEHLQAVIVCHTDQKHPHVHVILNRVDPATGKMLATSNDRLKLSDWANAYERERGLIMTPKREEKRELREQFADRADRQEYAGEKRRQAEAGPKSRAGMLKEFSDKQKADHKQQWTDLSAENKRARAAVYDAYDERIKEAISRHKIETKPIWSAFFRQQRHDARRLGTMSTLRQAWEAAKLQKAQGLDGGRGMLSLVFANTISGQARRAIFDRQQEMKRTQLSAELRGILDHEIGSLKNQRASGLVKQRSAFDQARASLMEKQDAERAKMGEAWRQIYSDRGKEPFTRSAPYRRRMDAAEQRKANVAAVKEQRSSAAPTYRRDVTPTREEIAKGLDRKEQIRRSEWERQHPTKPAFVSRPAPAPAPSGFGPQPAQKSPQHIPAKALPEVKRPADPTRDFSDAAERGTDQPRHSQTPSEIRAAYAKAGTSRLEQKREQSRGQTRGRGRTRTRNNDGSDLDQ